MARRATVAVGLGVTLLFWALAVGAGFWQAKDGCEAYARRDGRELVENRWWAKGGYCVTRDAGGTTRDTNETWPFMFLVVLAAIPAGAAAGGLAMAAVDRISPAGGS
jgi:hypothetical protein